ncbi:hypothetical protein M231_02889 [Tremella mesenterica]|uniref:Glycosyltransferase 61 catalytic domain-containing protein n=1 Tax=Tremella mesenterica TaxID=5217 RepID=A0A4Q1BPJ8_TREME|nr:hypothetical protein M231_02889 [Tremella mesenterica]
MPSRIRTFVSAAVAAVILFTLYSYSGPVSIPSTENGSVYVSVGQITGYVKGIAGTTLWENIYLRNGTWFIITPIPQRMPSVGEIMCDSPLANRQHPPAGEDRLRFLHPNEAMEILGSTAVRKTGLSMFFNDEPGPNGQSFLAHYFHSEVFLSAWRVTVSAYGTADIPERLMYRTVPTDWRDKAGLTPWFQQTIMPRTAVEDAPLWIDKKNSGTTFVFDRRFAAHNHGNKVRVWNKMTMDLPDLPVPSTWMVPLRNALKAYALANGCDLHRHKAGIPVVTYVNRQMTSRRLVASDAEDLVMSLQDLEDRGEIEFNNAFMESIPRAEQFCLALKTDILVGVHGNGLSHQLWMRPGGAVLELMDTGGFAMDYALCADLMKHDYYAIRNDTYLHRTEWLLPNGQPMQQGSTFHSDHLRVYAPYVADLVSKLARSRSRPVSESDL